MYVYLKMIHDLLSSIIIILKRLLCPNGILIVGRWCSTPCIEAKEVL